MDTGFGIMSEALVSRGAVLFLLLLLFFFLLVFFFFVLFFWPTAIRMLFYSTQHYCAAIVMSYTIVF